MDNDAKDMQPANGGRRRRLIGTALAGFALTGLAWAGWWWFSGRFEQVTDDAYVAGDLVQVTPQSSGTIVAINADDTDRVHAGQLLVEFDDADARVGLAQAEARLAQAVREARRLNAAIGQAEADVTARRVDLDRARQDLARRQRLAASQAVSAEDVAHAADAQQQAAAALQAAQQQLAAARAAVVAGDIRHDPQVAGAVTQVEEAWLNLARCRIQAPVDGIIARRSAQVGQKVAIGTPLMNIVPLDHLWVEANLKEDQLANVRPGQTADITADTYGSRVHYQGRVIGIGAGTGSVFSLLPPQNATGNWIKIVQRVPVRISLDPSQLHDHPLRPGLSVRVDIDTRSKPVAVAMPAATMHPADSIALGNAAHDVDRIIRANMQD